MAAQQEGRRRQPAGSKRKHCSTAQDPAKRQCIQEQRHKLPVWLVRERLVEVLKSQPIQVVVGETGSGKTTQIPQFIFQSRLAGSGLIACTQPRRLAAITVAQRVADEMGAQLGQLVGYSIRFDDTTSESTRIKYMTDGMLLREAILDPLLSRYKVVMVDEAHERTIHTDVLLGLLKGVQKQRGDDLKLIIMSATLDAARFLTYFGMKSAVYIPGRQFPVQILYTAQPQDNYVSAAVAAALQVHLEEGPGDILVFLTGQEEIESTERLLAEQAAALPPGNSQMQLTIVTVFAAMPPENQVKVLEPAVPGVRKVILATNIAETSITLPGVRFVIDTGFVKARAYHAKLGLDSLQVVPISKAQARQRSGRAGRECPGKVFRLYTETAFRELASTTPPEIQRSSLSGTVLQLLALGVKNVLHFDFMDPPPKAAVVRSLEVLYALGALDDTGNLTDSVGTRLARLPLDPMFGKVLLSSHDMCCTKAVLGIVAMLSVDNVFFNPREKQHLAKRARGKFVDSHGDHLTLLNVFNAFRDTTAWKQAQWCSDHFLNMRALRKAIDVHAQLSHHMAALSLTGNTSGETNTDAIRRALVSGLFMNATRRKLDGTYRVVATGQLVHIHPSSVMCGSRPECFVFDELICTSKEYAHNVCVVEPRWLPELVPAFLANKVANPGNGTV